MNEAIVVLHYNKVKLTRACVDSILQAGYPAEQVYCYDNGSKPEMFAEVKQLYPNCHHQRREKNGGFSGGFNGALEWVFAEGKSAALFLTNDTVVFPGALEECSKRGAETNTGMVAPMVVYLSNNHSIDSIGGWFDCEKGILNHYHHHELPVLLDRTRDYIPGTALWINKEFFRELGGADESFHMYWEDVDLCFRAHEKGLRMSRCYEAKIAHGVGQTCRKKPLYTTFYFHRNRIRFCKRYLKGDQLATVLDIIEHQLKEMKEMWQLNGDLKRLTYMKELMSEFKS